MFESDIFSSDSSNIDIESSRDNDVTLVTSFVGPTRRIVRPTMDPLDANMNIFFE